MSKIKQNKYLIPLYLGISGHRDIRDEDRETLKQFIKEFIEEKHEQCPFTPIVLLTPLAEGADRIAAQAAIECKIDFVALLPMPKEEYKRDFELPESVEEFEKLILKAYDVKELPFAEGTTFGNIQDHEKRNEQYYQNGLFLAQNCHTLIALWDGTENGKRGGTADIVRLKEKGVRGKYKGQTKNSQHLQPGPVYHIFTPRKSASVTEKPKVYTPHFKNDDQNVLKAHDVLLAHIDLYNKDVTRLESSIKKKINTSAKCLIPDHSEFSKNYLLKDIAYKHGVSSELSTYFQRRRFRIIRLILALVVVAFLFWNINSSFFNKPILILFYPLTMGFAAILYKLAQRNKYEQKHEDYRALSEAYRVQFFLKAMGREENVSDHYLKNHQGELDWIIYSLRTMQVSCSKKDKAPNLAENYSPMSRINFVKTSWVDDQLKYFNLSSPNQNRSAKKWEWWTNFFFLSAIVSACLLFVISYLTNRLPANLKYLEVFMRAGLSCSTSVFLVLAAVLHAYSDKMIFSEQAKNYQLMAEIFRFASKNLNQAIEKNDINKANDIIDELVYDALYENGNWLLLHRSRPMELPKG